MNNIIDCLSYVLGLLMDVFFRGLTFIGYPRLWACIVLYAIATRFFFLPQRINIYKNKLLAPVVRRDILAADPGFFESTKDKELILKRNALKKEVNKKYGLSNSSGCLVTLIQYPFLVALFYVVKNPQEFIPSLESLTHSSEVNTFLGFSLSAIPFNNISFNGIEGFILLVPLIIVISNIIKLYPTLKRMQTRTQKIISYSLCGLLVLLIGWLSATLPIVISLYWLVSDITMMIFDFLIHKFLPKNKTVAKILKYYQDDVEREALLKTDSDIEENDAYEESPVAPSDVPEMSKQNG